MSLVKIPFRETFSKSYVFKKAGTSHHNGSSAADDLLQTIFGMNQLLEMQASKTIEIWTRESDIGGSLWISDRLTLTTTVCWLKIVCYRLETLKLVILRAFKEIKKLLCTICHLSDKWEMVIFVHVNESFWQLVWEIQPSALAKLSSLVSSNRLKDLLKYQ